MFFMGVFAKCFVYGRLQNAPTQHTLKVIDYQVYKLFQSFGTLTKFMMQKRFLDFSDSLFFKLSRISRIFTKLEVHKSLYFFIISRIFT